MMACLQHGTMSKVESRVPKPGTVVTGRGDSCTTARCSRSWNVELSQLLGVLVNGRLLGLKSTKCFQVLRILSFYIEYSVMYISSLRPFVP